MYVHKTRLLFTTRSCTWGASLTMWLSSIITHRYTSTVSGVTLQNLQQHAAVIAKVLDHSSGAVCNALGLKV